MLFILIGAGFGCGKKGVLNEQVSKKMTDIVLYLVTPCVMVSAFQRPFSWELLGKVGVAALTATAVMIAAILTARLFIRDKNENRRKVLQFAVIFSNCGFMSLPLQKALLGDDGWFFGSIFVAVFNVCCWTYGLVDMSGDKKLLSFKKLALNPGIIGVIAATILFVCQIHLPEFILAPVTHLANLNTPLPMLIIGFYLVGREVQRQAFPDKGTYLAIAAAAGGDPLGGGVCYGERCGSIQMTVAFAIASSAPTAATTTMFCAKFNRDVRLSVGTVAATTLASITTMPPVVSLAYTLSGI